MLKDLLKEVVVIVAGKQSEGIAELLESKKHVNEFSIAKKMDITINQTRNILYKISDHGLVSFIRKKDKKKGWYTYFWKIEILKSLEFLREILLKKINQIEHQIKSRETKMFYICERCNIEFNEENALLHNFTCEDCGDLFVVKDNLKDLKELNRTLEKFQKELEGVGYEISIEMEKLGKQRFREDKKVQKEKDAQKVLKKALTAKNRAEKIKISKLSKKIPPVKKNSSKKTSPIKKAGKKIIKKNPVGKTKNKPLRKKK